MISSESFLFSLIYLYLQSITLLPLYDWADYITASVLLYYNYIATLILLGAYITAYVQLHHYLSSFGAYITAYVQLHHYLSSFLISYVGHLFIFVGHFYDKVVLFVFMLSAISMS